MQVKWGQSHDDVERKVPIAILEWSSLINPESIEPFLPKAPPSTEHNHSCAFSLHSKRYYVFVLFSYSKCRKMKGEWDNDVLQAWFKPIPPQKHHSWVCLGKWLWYISYLTISTLILQPQPNANVCFYLSHNAMMTLSGRLRRLKGNTAGAVCAVDLSSFMRAICFNSRYTSYTARPANRKPHNHKHLPSRFSCYSLTLCCTEAYNRRLTHCNLSGAQTSSWTWMFTGLLLQYNPCVPHMKTCL